MEDRSTGRARGRAQRGRARGRPGGAAERQEAPGTAQSPASASFAPTLAPQAPTPAQEPHTPEPTHRASHPASEEYGSAPAQHPKRSPPDSAPVGATAGTMVQRPLRSGDAPDRGRGGLSRKLDRYSHETVQFLERLDKIGKNGTRIQLMTNYIPMRTLYGDEFEAYMFNCDWEPRLSVEKRRRLIMKLAAGQNWGGYSYDSNVLFIRKPIHEGDTTRTLKFPLQLGDSGKMVTLFMKYTGKVIKNSKEYFHLLNVLFNEGQRLLGLKQIRDDFFNPLLAQNVNQLERGSNRVLSTLSVWPGYKASISSVDDNLTMLCCDVSHKVFTVETLSSAVKKMTERYGRNDTHRALSDVRNAYTGQIVYTKYNNRTWRVDDLSFNISIDSTFETRNRDGTVCQKSYRDYYKERYGERLEATDQPMVITKPKKKDLQKYHKWRKGGEKGELQDEIIYIPSELCTVTGLSESQRNDFNLMKDMNRFIRQGPRERFENLSRFAGVLKNGSRDDKLDAQKAQKFFADWGMEFHDQLLSINGRVLGNIPIHMFDTRKKNLGEVPQERPGSWDNALRNCGVNPTCNINNWCAFYGSRDEGTWNNFLECLRRVSNGLNCRLAPPQTVAINQNNTVKWVEEIARRIENTQLIFVVLPRQDANMYTAIKKTCYIDYPVNCQCVVARTIGNPKKTMSVATKVLLQMACKMGYSAWVSPMHAKLTTAMIVGIDVYHKRKQASVQAAVFSYNKDHTQYYSSAVVDTMMSSEVNPRLGIQFEAGLENYRKQNNGRLPDRIIVYRDGIGDTMLCAMKEMEIKHIQDAVNRKYEACGQSPPNVVIVVLKKRINTRLFTRGRSVDNPQPGTIVDTQITKPNFCDFFLVSQMTRQGSVTPTHYNKVYDNFKDVGQSVALPVDILQRLTYVLCHLYYNWPGTICVPAPTHYAHRLAYLIGQHLGRAPDPRLCDRLFYL